MPNHHRHSRRLAQRPWQLGRPCRWCGIPMLQPRLVQDAWVCQPCATTRYRQFNAGRVIVRTCPDCGRRTRRITEVCVSCLANRRAARQPPTAPDPARIAAVRQVRLASLARMRRHRHIQTTRL